MKEKIVYSFLAINLLLGILLAIASAIYTPQGVPPEVNSEGLQIVPVVKTMVYSEPKNYIATAYCGCSKCCGKNDCITATGTRATEGRTIAVDPAIIPYGTKVYIPQFGQYYIAEDCGGAIKGNKIDIFMNSESECDSWGRRNIEIYIVG